MPAPAPFQDCESQFARFLQKAGAPGVWRDAWEELLFTIPARAASAAEWGTRESVGAAALLARGGAEGPALVLGSGLLGTAPARAALGGEVVAADDNAARVEFVNLRARANNLTIRGVQINADKPLPFADATFASAIVPDAPAGLPGIGVANALAEARRVLKPGGDLIFLASNRFGYKRFTGLHGRFEKPGIAGLARRIFIDPTGERTLRGWRGEISRAGFVIFNECAAYVSHLDYHYLASLDRKRFPKLEIGPKERANVMKWIGYRLGLFPWLAPSFAIAAAAADGASITQQKETWMQHIARAALEAAGADGTAARVDHLLATRGNAALLLVNGGARGVVARVPLCGKEDRLGRVHLQFSERLRARIGGFPAPRPFGECNIRGARVWVEERLPGWNAAQFTGDANGRERTYLQLSRLLAQLRIEDAVLDEPRIEELIHSRARLTASRVREAETANLILSVARAAGAALLGRRCPLVIAHGDLRAKHCLVGDAGEVTGLLDWGTAREPNLPLFDILHFIVHDRKQQFDATLDDAATSTLLDRSLHPREERAIVEYCNLLGIDDALRAACERLYPIEVATTAFLNWDYDRPNWVKMNFGTFLQKAIGRSWINNE
ncbi:MAG: phosphotransferase [Planctomycetes bacterium]|nr:phosphotransferase [Planctomycetota bacterium]